MIVIKYCSYVRKRLATDPTKMYTNSGNKTDKKLAATIDTNIQIKFETVRTIVRLLENLIHRVIDRYWPQTK